MKTLKCFVSERDIYETEQEIEYLRVIQALEKGEKVIPLPRDFFHQEEEENREEE